MASDIIIKGVNAKKGERMTRRSGYRLVATKGRKRIFKGTLMAIVNVRNQRLAIFSVPNR